MDVQLIKQLLEFRRREKRKYAENERKKTGRDRATSISMVEERLIKMKEAVDSGLIDASAVLSGISAGMQRNK
ncbi:hypothetical protein AC623_08415 [Bacillus sp. FJAT-27231]|uniref:hypothetical protein n=1 Tax=Bacillus sp. FJAT-27231 TaxID=1679168 RepID=UPI0006714871|nr:hypothetical protein [Bacillus sp. FJAT-27231]KMY53988.1 hypothetical protein AC623_08415 [Bacillus sp. FJAT-27231]